MEKMRKASILILTALMMSSGSAFGQSIGEISYNNSSSNTIQADIESQRVPAGTRIKIRMENTVNTLNSPKGSPFIATIIEDIKVKNDIILPVGTIIRGNVGNIKPNSFLSRGAVLTLNFDHVVTPMGRQIPVSVVISNTNNLLPDGSISAGGGYINAVAKSFNEGLDIVTGLTNAGVKAGLSFGQGYPVILTAPIAAFTGVTLGSSVFCVRSVVALGKKGDNVILSTGQILEITLVDAMDVPIN